jgi:Raf kinase inhibitor-like YbhB/YbcL family protein
MSFTLSSTNFQAGGEIPTKFTCEGEDVSPALQWTDPPPNTRSLALIVDDPDAPDPAAPKRVYVHWVLYNLPPDVRALGEAIEQEGVGQGKNDWGRVGYGGPCPPIGRHRYFFKLYALDTVLPDLHEPTKAQLEQAMANHIVAQAELMGTYQKREKAAARG